MMNETVARIVEIMFQNTEMNDEVQAIKDEVMNNCQERYQDLVNRGVNEDEAIAAVVESLKGMEEVIAQYPRKHEELEDMEDMDDDMDDTEVDKEFAAYLVKQVMVTLPSDDVNVETSMDENVHVYYDKEDFKNIRVQLNNGVLAIDRMNEVEKPESPRVKVEISQKDDEEEESGWQNLSDMISSIGKKLNKLRVNIQINNQGGGEITIAVPENHPVELDIHTASGDVDIDGVNATTIAAGTTSGDVTVQLPGDVKPQEIKVKGTSGDVDVQADAANLVVQTVSGDVEYNGDCPNINLHTVSGDAELNGVMQAVALKTVSGDVSMHVQGCELRNVNCNTTSGDLSIHLSKELRGQVAVELHSVSGDKHNHFGEPVGAPLAYVNANSVSGDVTIS